MHTMEIICNAIHQRRLLQFQFEKHTLTVEPQILGKVKAGNMVLRAWQVSGHNGIGSRLPWRDFPIARLSEVHLLTDTFEGPRPGYIKQGGKKFVRIFCELMEDLHPS